jgi:hypothetical protein
MHFDMYLFHFLQGLIKVDRGSSINQLRKHAYMATNQKKSNQ